MKAIEGIYLQVAHRKCTYFWLCGTLSNKQCVVKGSIISSGVSVEQPDGGSSFGGATVWNHRYSALSNILCGHLHKNVDKNI